MGTGTLSSGTATFSTSSLNLGSHSITAFYGGDTGFNTSDNSASALSQTVNQASTSTTVSSSPNPSVSGQAVVFTATVNAVSPGGGTRTGTVQFKGNGANMGSPVTLSGGTASLTNSTLAVGSITTITAFYSGDSNFSASDNTGLPITQTVNKAGTTIAISSLKNPATFGDAINFTATVSATAPGSGTPSGTVQFTVDGSNLNGLETLSGGTATSINTATLSVGTHTIGAVYSGDGNFNNNSVANFTQTVSSSQLTPATGGSAISADGSAGLFVTLTGPAYTENNIGNAGTGTITLNAPAGFIFDTGGSVPTVRIDGGSSSKNINTASSGTSLPMTSITTTQLIFTVTTASASGGTPNTLTWQDVRVRPTAGTPLASGNITNSGSASLSGVPAGATFGFLQETAGAASKLVVLTFPPSTATAGAAFSPQPGIQIQDQFGNARTFNNGNSDTSTVVTAARNTGTSSVQGTVTATANNGVATFSNLSYNKAETITLVFTSGTLTSANSGNIIVSPAAASLLVFTTQPGSATYGSIFGQQPVIKSQDAFGNNSTDGLPASKMVTLTLTGGSGTLSGTTS